MSDIFKGEKNQGYCLSTRKNKGLVKWTKEKFNQNLYFSVNSRKIQAWIPLDQILISIRSYNYVYTKFEAINLMDLNQSY